MLRQSHGEAAMRLGLQSMQARELALQSLHRGVDALDLLIHGVQLVGGHGIARELVVAPFGFVGQLADFR